MNNKSDNPFDDTFDIENDDFLASPVPTTTVPAPTTAPTTTPTNTKTQSLLSQYYFNYKPIKITSLFHQVYLPNKSIENEQLNDNSNDITVFYIHWLTFTISLLSICLQSLSSSSTKSVSFISSFILKYITLLAYSVIFGTAYCFIKRNTINSDGTNSNNNNNNNNNKWIDIRVIFKEMNLISYSYISLIITLVLNFLLKITINIFGFVDGLSVIIGWILCTLDYCIRTRYVCLEVIKQEEENNLDNGINTNCCKNNNRVFQICAIQLLSLLLIGFIIV